MPEIHVVQPPPQYHNRRKNYKAPILTGTMAGVAAGVGGYLTSNPTFDKVEKTLVEKYGQNVTNNIKKDGGTQLKSIVKNLVKNTSKNFCEILGFLTLEKPVSDINKTIVKEGLKKAAIIGIPTAIVTGLAAGISANSKNK